MFWRRLPGAIRGVEAGTPGAAPRRSVCAALTRRLWTLSCSCQVQQRPFSRAPPPEAAETPLTTRGRRRHETRLPERGAARRSGAAPASASAWHFSQMSNRSPGTSYKEQRRESVMRRSVLQSLGAEPRGAGPLGAGPACRNASTQTLVDGPPSPGLGPHTDAKHGPSWKLSASTVAFTANVEQRRPASMLTPFNSPLQH